MSVALRAELLCHVGGKLLEGPSWVEGEVRFVDILSAEYLSFDFVTGELRRHACDETCSAWIARQSGGSLLACRSALRVYDAAGEEERRLPLETDVPGNRTNDAKCDPRGRLWVGTMSDEGDRPDGGLYRVEGDEVERVLAGTTISNGLGWSPDGSRMYYIDSPLRRIDVFKYDLDTGRPTSRRTLADVAHHAGVPDGLAVDAEGCLWVAFHDGAAVHRFSPGGDDLGTVSVPAARPTSCAFIGDELDRLAITTAAAPDGSGGDLFVCIPGVAGLSVASAAT